jgi:hypothetical protein
MDVDARTIDAPRPMHSIVSWTGLSFEGRALAFTAEGSKLLVVQDGSLFAIDTRDGARDELARSLGRLVGAVAVDTRRVVVWDDRAALFRIERGVVPQEGGHALSCPPELRPVCGSGSSTLSPSGRFFAVGGFVGAERTWRVAFFDLDAPEELPWIVDDERVRGVRYWLGESAVVVEGLVCDPTRRLLLDDSDARVVAWHVSPRGRRGFEQTGQTLRLVGDSPHELPFPLDSSDELRWVDDRFVVHAASPYALIDAERGLVHPFGPGDEGRGRLVISPDVRRAAWSGHGRVTIGDVLVHPPSACAVDVSSLPSRVFRATAERAHVERLALQVAERAVAWGLDVSPEVHWSEGPAEDAELAVPWERPIADALRDAHRARDGHRAVFDRALTSVCAELERSDEPSRWAARMLLLDGDVRSAAALDLRLTRGPRARASVASLGNPFAPALELAACGVVLLDVGLGGVRLLRPG